jgi:hypothetical protein
MQRQGDKMETHGKQEHQIKNLFQQKIGKTRHRKNNLQQRKERITMQEHGGNKVKNKNKENPPGAYEGYFLS